jgi:hypothetical protein
MYAIANIVCNHPVLTSCDISVQEWLLWDKFFINIRVFVLKKPIQDSEMVLILEYKKEYYLTIWF